MLEIGLDAGETGLIYGKALIKIILGSYKNLKMYLYSLRVFFGRLRLK